ncbi:MAG: GNAT family N-acetyltransferase [Verrucomicrobiota bacterium]
MIIESLATPVLEKDREELIALLTECVAGGASIGFLAPLARGEAEAYWDKIIGDLRGGYRILLAVRESESGDIIGSAQLALEARANGRHRAEVQKVMVRPAARRRGIASELMRVVEAMARERQVTLLFLDTSDSHAGARPLYEALRYVYVGGIPGYALNTHGKPEANAIYYKMIEAGGTVDAI